MVLRGTGFPSGGKNTSWDWIQVEAAHSGDLPNATVLYMLIWLLVSFMLCEFYFILKFNKVPRVTLPLVLGHVPAPDESQQPKGCSALIGQAWSCAS